MTAVLPETGKGVAIYVHADGQAYIGRGLDGSSFGAVPPAALAGLATMLDVIADRPDVRTNREASVVISGELAARFGLPLTLPDHLRGGHIEALEEARAAGWQSGQVRAWTTFYGARRPSLHVLNLAWIDQARDSLAVTGRVTHMVDQLARWQTLLGSAYRGTPGVAGTAVLRAVSGSGRTEPTWRPDSTNEAVQRFTEPEYVSWSAPDALLMGVGSCHTYDANMAYLAAAQTVEVPRFTLTHGGRMSRIERERSRLGGWFRLEELPPWNDPQLPNPLGYGRRGTWVATPTLELLDQLSDEGLSAGVVVVEHWTAPSYRTLRPWAETIRDALAWATARDDGADLVQHLKATYRETIGMMHRPGGRAYRPEWQASVVAQARCNLWRKLQTVARNEGRWPVSVNGVDSVTYWSEHTDPVKAAPVALAIRPGLGGWKVKHDA